VYCYSAVEVFWELRNGGFSEKSKQIFIHRNDHIFIELRYNQARALTKYD
jgi:hypothetical protein